MRLQFDHNDVVSVEETKMKEWKLLTEEQRNGAVYLVRRWDDEKVKKTCLASWNMGGWKTSFAGRFRLLKPQPNYWLFRVKDLSQKYEEPTMTCRPPLNWRPKIGDKVICAIFGRKPTGTVVFEDMKDSFGVSFDEPWEHGGGSRTGTTVALGWLKPLSESATDDPRCGGFVVDQFVTVKSGGCKGHKGRIAFFIPSNTIYPIGVEFLGSDDVEGTGGIFKAEELAPLDQFN